jgi:NAD(P)-dependent dehydrogenase (short-subunit alcohol dehydrogenase family)
MDNVLQYAGKRVVITGAASGVGVVSAQILVDLGAEVHTIDTKKPDVTGLASFTECDFREPEQITAAVDRIGKVVNALFNCAEPPKTFSDLDVMLVRFCGLRHLTERVVPNLVEGSAIASVASTGGTGGRDTSPKLTPLLETDGFAAARTWCETHADEITDAYDMSSEAIAAYVARQAPALAKHGIRINCVATGRVVAERHAWPLLFLNSPRASSVSGEVLRVEPLS